MQARAFVPFGNVGQSMSRFYLKNSEDIHMRIVTAGGTSRNGHGQD
jgi:hypothetical protein